MALRILRLVAAASMFALVITARTVMPAHASSGDPIADVAPAAAESGPTAEGDQPAPDRPPIPDPRPKEQPPEEPEPIDDEPVEEAPPPEETVEPTPTEPPPPDAEDVVEPAPTEPPPPEAEEVIEPTPVEPPIVAEEPTEEVVEPSPVAPPVDVVVTAEPPAGPPTVAEPPVAEPVEPAATEPAESGAIGPSALDQSPAGHDRAVLPPHAARPHASVPSARRAPAPAAPAAQVVDIEAKTATPVPAPKHAELQRLDRDVALNPVVAAGAGLAAGLAVTTHVPPSVAVAVEFGKAGGGWAGAIVFNLWLRRQMRERRMSQRQLAFLAGIDHSTISRLLKQDRRPSLTTATKLAGALRQVEGELAEPDTADYFDRIPEETLFPTRRVELALRADEMLDEEQVRQLMRMYQDARRRHQPSPQSRAAPARAAPGRRP